MSSTKYISFKDRALGIILNKAKYSQEWSAENIFEVFCNRVAVGEKKFKEECLLFGRELAIWKNEYNTAIYHMIEQGAKKLPPLILSTSKGYFPEKNAKEGQEGRDFYYSRVKDVIEQTKIIDKVLSFKYGDNSQIDLQFKDNN